MNDDPIEIVAGLRLVTPTGDVYRASWDMVSERMVLALELAGDRRKHTPAMAITPRAANAIEIKPRRRED